MSTQIPLDLTPDPDRTFESFVETPANREALIALSGNAQWPSPVLRLIGPAGSGKTHLAGAWSDKVGAVLIDGAAADDLADCPPFLCVDDADNTAEPTLFALINTALRGDMRALLLTFAAEPAPEMPDLRSRLSNMPAVYLADFDDDYEPVLRKLFEDRGRMVRRDVVRYLLDHADRSPEALQDLVIRLDMAARSEKKDLTRAFTARFMRDA